MYRKTAWKRLRSIFVQRANFETVIAFKIQQWCWTTDPVFRALQRATCEAVCRMGCENGPSTIGRVRWPWQTWQRLPKSHRWNFWDFLGISGNFQEFLGCAGAQNDGRPSAGCLRASHCFAQRRLGIIKIGARGKHPRIFLDFRRLQNLWPYWAFTIGVASWKS